MKQRLIVLLVVGALIVTAGIASLTLNARGSKGEEIPSQQVTAKGSKGEEIPSREVVMRGASEKDTVQASLDDGRGASDTEPVLAQSKGGLCGPPDWLCYRSGSEVLADGLTGGVVLSPSVVEAGGLNGGVVLNTDHVELGGKGGISDDTLIAGGKGGISGDTIVMGGKGGIGGDMSW